MGKRSRVVWINRVLKLDAGKLDPRNIVKKRKLFNWIKLVQTYFNK